MAFVAFFEGAQDNVPKQIEMSWADLIENLTKCHETDCAPCPGKDCTAKYIQAWSPVRYREGATRGNAGVLAVSLAGIDIDHASEEVMEGVLTRLAGVRFIMHTTHSHRPPNDGAYRLIIDLAHPIHPREYSRFYAALIQKYQIPADPACKDLARLYFFPSVCRGGIHEAGYQDGEPLDPEEVLAGYTPSSAELLDVDDATPVPVVDSGGSYDIVQARRIVADHATSLAHRRTSGQAQANSRLLRRALEGQPIADAPAPGRPGGRDHAFNRLFSILGHILYEYPFEVAFEVVRPGFNATDKMPEGEAHWIAEVRDQWERARQRKAVNDATTAQQTKAVMDRLLGTRKPASSIAATISATPATPVPTPPEGDTYDDDYAFADPNSPAVENQIPVAKHTPEEAKALLEKNLKVDSKGKILNIASNVYAILAYADGVRGTLRWNEITKTIEIHGGPFAGTDLSVLDATIQDWFSTQCDMQITDKVAGKRALMVALENRYDPLKEYLNSVVWDRTPRLDTFLEVYCGAETTQDGTDITAHVRRISARWLISCVARGLRPGCKVDTVLVLEGNQGIGKSEIFAILGGPFFSDTSVNLGDKDSRLLAAYKWIIEEGELAPWQGKEYRALKQFHSQRVDHVRPPYGAAHMEFLRRCVFVGTTNDAEYLNDPTGARRYWPVKCGNITPEMHAMLERDRDQLWAEAVARFHVAATPEAQRGVLPKYKGDVGELWWLLRHEDEAARMVTRARETESLEDSIIEDWWFSLDKYDPTSNNQQGRRMAALRAQDVARLAFQITPDKVQQAKGLLDKIAISLKRMGFEKKTARFEGRVSKVWVPPDKLLHADKGTFAERVRKSKTTQLVVIQGGKRGEHEE